MINGRSISLVSRVCILDIISRAGDLSSSYLNELGSNKEDVPRIIRGYIFTLSFEKPKNVLVGMCHCSMTKMH